MWKILRGWGSIQGALEAVRHRTVFGWAYDSRQPHHPVTLRIQVNGQECGIAVADRPRRDLEVAGLASRRRGFEWTIPDSCSRIESVKVLTVDEGVELPATDSAICPCSNRPLPAEWISGNRLRLPSFFILGAAKCGTTAVHKYLGQHPEICVSNPKEPFFFEAEYARGPAYYFNRYFAHWSGERITGESRHRNLYMPYTAARIFRFNPDAKLVVCLRNPVERAISHWASWYFSHKELLPLGKSIEQDWERIRAGVSYEEPENQDAYARALDPEGKGILRTYVDSGYYYDQIQRYLALFPREQMHIILQEDLARDTGGVMAELCDFLGADAAPARKGDYVRANESHPDMRKYVDSDTVAWLVRHYRPHNELLGSLLGRSLEHWDVPFRSSTPRAESALYEVRS